MRVHALDNFRGFTPRSICNSVDYVGDSSSSLTSSILGVVGQAASSTAVALAGGGGTSGRVPMYSQPVYRPTTPTSSSSIWLFALLALGAFFAYKELK
jgi:MYXO-CTERM domain-containing protein